MKLTKLFKLLASGLCLAAGLQASNQARAQSYFTTNVVNIGTYSWDGNNWGATTTGPFTSAFTSGNVADFYAPVAAYSVTVAAAETISGLEQAGTNTLTITNASGTGSLNIATTGAVLFTNAGVQVAAAQQFYLYGNVLIYAPITGPGGVEQRANDALGLFGTNSYSGGTVLTGGQVTEFNNNSSFGVGNIVFQSTGEAMENVALTMVTITNNVYFQGTNFAENFVSGSAGVNYAGTFFLPPFSTNNFEVGGGGGGNLTTIGGVISGVNSAINPTDSGTKTALFNLFGTNTYTSGTILNTTNIMVGFNSYGSFGLGPIFIKNSGIFISNAAPSTATISNSIIFNATGNALGVFGTNTTFAGNITLPSSGSIGFTNENGANFTFLGTIGGGAELFPEGKGTLILDATNTYSGGTYMNNANVAYRYNNGSVFGTGTNYIATSSDIPFEAVGSTPIVITNTFAVLVNNAAINFNSSVGGTGGANVSSGNWYLGTNTLDIRNDGNTAAEYVTLSGAVIGAGAVQFSANNNAPIFNLFGVNTYSGGSYIGNASTAAPIVAFNNSQSFGSGPIYNSGTNALLLVATGGSAFTLPNNISMTNAPVGITFSNASGTSLTLAGVLSGTGNALFASGSGGTTFLSAHNTYTGTTTVRAGATLELALSGAISSSSGLVLSGGTLDPDGLTQAISPLTVSSNSAINFEAGGAEVDFANSSAQTWTGILNLTNWTASVTKVRFGTDNTGLTTNELANIEFNGAGLGTAQLDANGYVIVVTPPASITILPPTTSAGNFTLSFATTAGQSYTVWGTTNLATTNWFEVTNFDGDGNTDQVSFPTTNYTAEFFDISTP